MIFTGVVLFVVGLLSMVTPIPGGTLAMTVGVGMIICASKRATDLIKKNRSTYHRLNRSMTWLENKMGERFSRALRTTRPDELPLITETGGGV